MVIRKAAQHETDRIIQIWLEASRIAHDFIPFEYWIDHVSDMREVYLPKASTFVFDEGNEITGFLSLVDTELAAIFISPEHQHRGYGKQLIQFAKTQSQYLSLCVYKNNIDAIGFYLESGFTPLEERLDSNTNQMEIVMTWSKPR